MNWWTDLRWRIAQFFEIRWWQRYLQTRDKAAYYDWKRAYWRDFLHKSGVEMGSRLCILDAGCGPAGIFTIFEDHEVIALDPLLGQYQSKIAQFDPADWPYVTFIEASLEDFKQEQAFDMVFCLNAINHVEDLALCFDRLVDLTQSGGQLLVSIDAHNYPLFKHVMRLIPGDILHPHQYDLKEYTTMLTDRGLHVTNTVRIKHEFIFDYYLVVCQKV
jgi:SAM-dependent methyltransferase